MEKTRTINLRFDKDGDRKNTGYIYNFNSLDDYFGMITDIQNLGLEFENSFILVGNRFILSQNKLAQKNLTFNINFKSYEKYKEFIGRCRWSNYHITVNYGIPINGKISSYRRDYLLKKIGKAEKKTGILVCPAELQPITSWYSFLQKYLNLKSDDYVTYGVGDDTDLESEIYFKISGSFKNLDFQVVGNDFDDKKMILNYEFNNTALIYSSVDNENCIKEQTTSGFNDLMNLECLDFANENIIKIPAGKEATLKFKSDEITENPSIYLEIRKYLISV